MLAQAVLAVAVPFLIQCVSMFSRVVICQRCMQTRLWCYCCCSQLLFFFFPKFSGRLWGRGKEVRGCPARHLLLQYLARVQPNLPFSSSLLQGSQAALVQGPRGLQGSRSQDSRGPPGGTSQVRRGLQGGTSQVRRGPQGSASQGSRRGLLRASLDHSPLALAGDSMASDAGALEQANSRATRRGAARRAVPSRH